MQAVEQHDRRTNATRVRTFFYSITQSGDARLARLRYVDRPDNQPFLMTLIRHAFEPTSALKEHPVKMKQLLFPALIALPLHSAFAGALYGTLRVGNAPAAGYTVAIECPGNQRALSATDAQGGYTLKIQAVGACAMWIQRGNTVGNRFSVFVSDRPMRLDLSIDGSLNRH